MKHFPSNIMAVNKRYYAAWANDYESARADGLNMGVPHTSKHDMEITGLLMASVPDYVRDMGLAATGYDDIEEQARALMQSPNDDVTIGISSGGGYVYGIDKALDALRELRAVKHVVIDVGEMAASAAYWLASVGHEIRVGRFSELGSIGAYVIVPDSSKMYEDFGLKINVVASGKDKGAGIEGTEVTPEQLEPEQERIDQIAAMFLADVQSYRNVDESVMSGRTWIGGVAVNMGLADTVSGANRRSIAMPENEVAAEVTAAETVESEVLETEPETVAEPEIESPAPDTTDDPVQAERTRCAEIAATFAHSLEFASMQIESGATLIMAKAAWFDYCKDHPENKPVAAKPSRIVAANQSPQPVAGNWTDALRACAAANNVSLSEAGRILSETNPELYRKNFE